MASGVRNTVVGDGIAPPTDMDEPGTPSRGPEVLAADALWSRSREDGTWVAGVGRPTRNVFLPPGRSWPGDDVRFDALLASMRDPPTVRRGTYNYYVFPITDGVPALSPDALDEVVEAVLEIADVDVDRIVTMEAMGIPIATALSLRTRIPFTIVRKRQYGLPGETEVVQETGYSHNPMFINGLGPGMRVLVVDDIISTGGTLLAILRALREIGVEVANVVMVVDKGDGRRRIREELGIDVKVLVRVEDSGDGPVVRPVLA